MAPLFWLKERQNTMAVAACGGGSPLHGARKQRKRHRAKDKRFSSKNHPPWPMSSSQALLPTFHFAQ